MADDAVTPRRARTGWRWRSTSTTSSPRCGWPGSCAPWFGVAKVGLELYSAAGPDAITALADLGFDVFADLKLHDIPTTVGRAARVLGALGARYLNVHAAGGAAMLRAGVEGLREGAAGAGLPEPVPLGGHGPHQRPEAPTHLLAERVAIGRRGRLRRLRVRRARHRHRAPDRPRRRAGDARHPPRGLPRSTTGTGRHAPGGAGRGRRSARPRAGRDARRRPRRRGPRRRRVARGATAPEGLPGAPAWGCARSA